MTRFTAQPRALAVGFAFVVYFGLLLIPEWRPGILTTALYFVYRDSFRNRAVTRAGLGLRINDNDDAASLC